MKISRAPSSLDNFKLFYEDMGKKMQHNKTSAHTIRSKKSNQRTVVLRESIAKFFNKIHDITHKAKSPRKKGKKHTKKQIELIRAQQKRGILGIGLLLVVVSIAYSTLVIIAGVDGPISKIILLPQALFALVTLLKAFSKIYQ